MKKVIHYIKQWGKKHPIQCFASALLLGLVMFVTSFYLYIAFLLPLPDPFIATEDNSTTKIFDRNGQLLYEVLQPDLGKTTIIPIEKIPQDLIDATLAAEDIHFYSHPGVDILAIGRAIYFNVQQKRIVSGASTITQQLVRNLIDIGPNRDIWDKTLEAMYAIRISNVYSKDEILELYLNKIYYGNLSYGIESAAQNYFGKHVYDLDLAQITFLAGLPQSPSQYNPYIYFDQSKKRQKYVLTQMAKHGFITQKEADSSFNESLKLRANKHPMKAPHFVQNVLNGLVDQYGESMVYRGGLEVYTTLDYSKQIDAESIIERHIDNLESNHVTNGSLITLDTTNGQVIAWVGSADYFDEEIDGAVDIVTSLRQPGSSIKPLNYLLAFENGYTPATIIFDTATQFSTSTGPYSPKNYDLEYHGPVRMRTALASSYNIPAVKTLELNGINSFISFLQKMGITTLDAPASHYGLALTLGGGEVRLIDMAQAYLVIANYGEKFDYSTILSIKDSNGDILFEWQKPESDYVLGPEGHAHAYQVMDILSDNNARIPGFGEESVLELSHTAAVKTGTTRNFMDNWTIGFSPMYLTAVWVGNADGSAMENISGIDGAAPIWADFMESLLSFSPNYSFEIPKNLSEIEICALSGKLPTEYCKDRIYEWFTKNSMPTEEDDYYQLFNINTRNGNIIADECINQHPSASVKQKVLVAYPAELQKWAVQKGLSLPQYEPCATRGEYADAYTNDYPPEQAHSIIIDNPAQNDEYIIDYSMPLDTQKVPFRVSVPYETIKVDYYVDGEHVAQRTEQPFTYLWMSKSGRHTMYCDVTLQNEHKIQSGKVDFLVK